LKSRHIENLDKWIESAAALENREISSFINGITRDINAVKMQFSMIIIIV